MGFDWKAMLGGIAPTLAKALLNPGAAAKDALQALSRALLGRDDGSADDVAEAIAAGASPEQVERIQAAEREFALKLVEVVVESEKIDAGDRANARAREVSLKDRMPAILAVVLSVGMFGAIVMLATVQVPPNNREALMLLVGALATSWAAAMAYYHGSSSSSRAKDATNAALLHRALGAQSGS